MRILLSIQDVVAMLAIDKEVIGATYAKKSVKWGNVKKAVIRNPQIEDGELAKIVGDYVFNPVKGTARFSVTESGGIRDRHRFHDG